MGLEDRIPGRAARTAVMMVARGEAEEGEDGKGRGLWGCGRISANQRQNEPCLEKCLGKTHRVNCGGESE
jgi:hypothetical protein